MINGLAPTRQAIVCDDDPMIVMVASALLQDAGFQVVATPGSVAELRDALTSTTPDVLVLDQMLPDSASDESVGMVATAAPGCRIILFSAREDPDYGHGTAIFARVPKRGTGELRGAIERAAADLGDTPGPL